MKLKTIKTLDEVMAALSQPQVIEREPIELTTKNGTIHGIRIGGLHLGASYGLEVSREIEFEEATRYRLTATVPGFQAQISYHEHLSDLREKQKTYGDAVETDDNSLKEVKVFVDDSGNVVGEVEGEQPDVGEDLSF